MKPSAGLDDRYKQLLAVRIRREDIVLGRVYVIHARNGGVGVAVYEDGLIGYRLHREKFGNHFLFVELDWDEDPQFGTAIPLTLIDAEPPAADDKLLAWLANQEDAHRAEINAAWEAILGFPRGRLR